MGVQYQPAEPICVKHGTDEFNTIASRMARIYWSLMQMHKEDPKNGLVKRFTYNAHANMAGWRKHSRYTMQCGDLTYGMVLVGNRGIGIHYQGNDFLVTTGTNTKNVNYASADRITKIVTRSISSKIKPLPETQIISEICEFVEDYMPDIIDDEG